MLENNISIVVSCMPAFAVFIKQNVSETAFFRSLRSALMPSSRGGGEKASGPGSGGSAGVVAAAAQKRWPGVSFPRQSDRQKLRHKTDHEEIGFDSYIELNDSTNGSRSDEGATATLKPPHLSSPRLAPVQLAAQQGQQQMQMPAYHVPEQGIVRTTEVTQQYYPASENVRGQAF